MPAATLSLDRLRPRVLEMAQAADPYPFLSVVEDYLTAVPEDDQARALALRALIGKGLHRVAIELCRACPPGSPHAAEMRTAADALSGLPAEVVAWPSTEAIFAANLCALGSRGATGQELADRLAETWRHMGGGLVALRSKDGNVLVRGVRSDGRGVWLPAALDFTGSVEAVPDPEAFKGSLLAPFLLAGVGIGCLVPRLWAASHRTFLDYSPAIYIVEPNLRALALALRLHDWTAVLNDERVFLLAGESAWERWGEMMRQNDSLPEPQRVTMLTPWPGSPALPAQETLDAVRRHRESVCARHRGRAAAFYSARDAASWAQRYETAGAGDPLRVLGITSRFTTFLQHSMRDALAALEHAGTRTRLLIEGKDYTLIGRHQVLDVIADFRPDLILVIDHHRHEDPGRFLDSIPYVCWIQDEMAHLFAPDVGRRLGPLDFTIGFGLSRCVLESGYPLERFMPCRLAVNPAKFARPGDAGEPDTSLRCDVAYVSHHSELPEALHARVRRQAGDEGILRLMDAFYEETRPLMTSDRFNGAYDLERLLADVEQKTGIVVTDAPSRQRLMAMYVRPLADRTLRHAALTWVADWVEATGRRLHLHGRGWDRHPRLGRYAQGLAEHGPHLGEIARQAAINLHAGLVGALHQRVLETIAAGGFLLIRRHPFDFDSPAYASLDRYLAEHRIDRPARVPFSALPADYVQHYQETAAITGRAVPDVLDITAEMLLETRARRFHPDDCEYASQAFPGLDRITFSGPEAFARQAEHFIRNTQEREEIVRVMQGSVEGLFTYDALCRRLIAFLTRALRSAALATH